MRPQVTPRRILVCDDEPTILEAYRRVLGDLVAPGPDIHTDFDALSSELFGDPTASMSEGVLAEIVYCQQGEEAVAAFTDSLESETPFAAVFLDMRMPPGIDGLEAARRIRLIDPMTNIVIVTGYSDHKPHEIAAAVGAVDRLFYLVKPFDADELRQLTTTLANRWTSDVATANELTSRLLELEQLNKALQESEASARLAARVDALTGLANRRGLEERFLREISHAAASGKNVSLLYLDLDRFKEINDSHGHLVGDGLIREIACRIAAVTGDNGFSARLGGDEFAVVCTDSDMLDEMIAKLLAISEMPVTIEAKSIPVSLSIGYASCGPVRTDLGEAMRCADMALYAAKDAGRGIAREFDARLDNELTHAQRLTVDLRNAIAADELMLHYQPLMSADGLVMTGVEALLRWTHPELGPISPQVFIGVAEKTNLIQDLGKWVIRRAFADAKLWPHIVTSINLSAAQFAPADFAGQVVALASEYDVAPNMIEFEITETFLSGDMAAVSAQICRLKDAGFRIALDDFGSGYAGLAYLTQVPFDKLKIDQAFVHALNKQDKADEMIKSIVGLGAAMGLSVTAEGVEEVVQHEILRAAGCDQMQGYLFHKPGSRELVQALADLQEQKLRAGST
jgi:diguanylate cyclase (GGDEF)-like protein